MTTVPLVETLGRMKLTMANFSDPSAQRFLTSHCVNSAVPPTTACAKCGISPCLKNRPTETNRFVCPDPDKSDTVIPLLGPPPPDVVTDSVTVAVCWIPPPLPVTVMG